MARWADPEMAIVCDAIWASLRLIQMKPQELFRVWIVLGPYLEQQSNRGRRANCPLQRLLDALDTIGAKMTDGGRVSHPATPSFMIQHLNVKECKPFLKETVCYKLVANLASSWMLTATHDVSCRGVEVFWRAHMTLLAALRLQWGI